MQQRLIRVADAHLDLIHVAAAGEHRGRVLLAARSATPHTAAIAATIAVAQAFEASLEALLIACPDVRALTAHDFARQVSHAGRIAPLSLAVVDDAQTADLQAARKAVTTAAANARCGVTVTTVHAQHGDALVAACRAEGPWNIVGLAEPIGPRDGGWLVSLLESLSGATGVVVVGSQATPAATGDVVVVVESIERLGPMLRCAERLAARRPAHGKPQQAIRMLLAAASREETETLDGLVRLALPYADEPAGGPRITVSDAGIAYGNPAELAEALRRLTPGFVIARSRGLALPADGSLDALCTVLRAPMLVVR